MHDTAAAFGAAFFRCYADGFEGARILEVGAGDVNGTLRGCAPDRAAYTGVDLEAGPGVDVVLSDPYTYPFESATYDVIVSTSCFEHDQMFWLSFAEMCRVLRAGGFIYLNVPSNGTYHRYPTDNWRFYPDAGLALAKWGRRNGHDIHLVESFIGRRRRDVWNDCVLVFAKGEPPQRQGLLAEIFPRSLNIRLGEEDAVANHSERTQDMILVSWLTEKLSSSPTPEQDDQQTTSIEALLVSLAEREVALGATERAAAERSAAAEAEIALLRDGLAERDGALQRLGEREAALARLQSELAQADGQLRQRKAEIDGLRRSVESLEREAEERGAAAAILREELAAARQVGRSLLRALGTAPLPEATDGQPVRLNGA